MSTQAERLDRVEHTLYGNGVKGLDEIVRDLSDDMHDVKDDTREILLALQGDLHDPLRPGLLGRIAALEKSALTWKKYLFMVVTASVTGLLGAIAMKAIGG